MFDDAVFWLSLGTLIVVLLSLARNSSPASNNSRLERKVDLILNHLGLDPNQGVDRRIVELMRSGRSGFETASSALSQLHLRVGVQALGCNFQAKA